MARHIPRDRPQNKYFVIVANSPVMLTNDSTTAVILSIIGLMCFSSFYTLLFYTFLKA
ncbi:Uncharacterised protein [Staphylococcus xylosus]|nr:Uncharacterised protein [Staphylococcus xylosus]